MVEQASNKPVEQAREKSVEQASSLFSASKGKDLTGKDACATTEHKRS